MSEAVSPRAADQAASERLPVARDVNRDADAKAGALLSGAGVLAAAASVLAGSGTSGPLATTAALGAGAALTAGMAWLLLVLLPRGGTPIAWMQTVNPVLELDRVTQIAARKHQLLRRAVICLLTAVALGVVAVGLTVAGVR